MPSMRRATVCAVIVLLLVADISCAWSGLLYFAPVTTGITVLGSLGLMFLALVLLLMSILGAPQTVAKRGSLAIGYLVFLGAIGVALHVGIARFGRPVADREATRQLARALSDPKGIQFDARVGVRERQAVIESKVSDWTLRTASPMIVGYDFDLRVAEDGTVGIRVSLPTLWKRGDSAWVFREFEKSD